MKSFLLTLGTVWFCIAPAHATVIYSTLGSSFPTYDGSHGYVVTGTSLPPGYVGLAVPFVPSSTFDITFVDLALIYVGGTNSAVVELQDDASGVPGNVLGSWTVTAAPNPYAEVGVLASGRVTSGDQYWISIQPLESDTALGWAFNSQGLTGPLAQTYDGTTYSTFAYTLPAFDVLGNPVPEPSTFVLAFTAFALLVRRVRSA